MANDESIRAVICENINRLLQERRMTQKELADHMHVSASTVNDWVKGKKIPRMDKIDKICSIFRVQREEVLYDSSRSDKTLQARKLFGSRLRRLLDERQLNQNELAKILGVSESTVGKWVLEKSMPRTMGTIQQLADYFGVGKSYFLETQPADGLPALSQREERDIERDLEDMMQSVASANFATKGAAEDNEALKAALRVAMISAKRAAKKKYTPRKYRK